MKPIEIIKNNPKLSTLTSGISLIIISVSINFIQTFQIELGLNSTTISLIGYIGTILTGGSAINIRSYWKEKYEDKREENIITEIDNEINKQDNDNGYIPLSPLYDVATEKEKDIKKILGSTDEGA